MFKARPSTPATINFILIVVITAILAAFGVVDYMRQRDKYYSDLNRELSSLTEQLSSSLALPLWNFQDDQAVKIIENALANKSIVGVIARDTITQRVVAARVRLSDGSVHAADEPPTLEDLLYKSARITFNSRDIGEVQVWGTTAHVREAMQRTLYRLAAGIAIINAALVALLSLVLSRALVRPLKAVETYALAVRSAEDAVVKAPHGFFLREMENLRDSIVIMMDKLKERYRQLQQSQAGLAEAEARYRNLYENALAGIYRCSADGTFLSANSAMARILGYPSPLELLDSVKSIDSQVFMGSPAFSGLMQRVKSTGDAATMTLNFKRAGGEERIGSLHARAAFGDDGEILYFDGMLEDVTERVMAEERVREAHAFVQNILDSMPSIMIGIDGGFKVTHVNKPAEAAMGLTHDQVIGKELVHVLPRLSVCMEAIGQVLEGKRPDVLTNRPFLHDGLPRQENILVFPVVQNGIPGAVIRVDDVTDQARMEELIIQTEKMMSLGGLAAGMAHEINNPLAGILQGVQNISRRISPALPANQKAAQEAGCSLESINAYLERREIVDFLQGIRDSGQRAAKIVSNMLSFTRKASAQAVSVRLDELLDRSLELASTDYDLKKKYDFKMIEIAREYQPDMPPVSCYPMEIEQVIINLLRNAAQAMASRPGIDPPPRISLRLSEKDGMAVIEVEDNGPGIEESVRTRVFDPFYTTKMPGEGTGLGLSVSYFIIARNHGGTIHVECEPGKGAKFVIRLPMRAAPGQARQEESRG